MPGADGFKQFIQGTLRWHPRRRASAYDLTRNPWLFFRGFREEEIEPRWIAPILNDREKRTLKIKKRELEMERAELARRMGMRTGPSAGPAGGSTGPGGAGPGPGLGPAPGTTSTTHGAAPGGTGSTEASTADAARMSGGSQGPATGGAAAAMGSGKASGDQRGAGGAPMDSGEGEGGVADLTAAPARGEGGAPMRTGSRSSTVPGSGSGSGAPMRTESEGSTVAGSGSGPCEPMDSGEGTAAAAGEHMDHFRSGSDVLRKLVGGGGGSAPPSGAFRVLPSLSAAQLGLLPHVGLEGVTSADALSRFPEAISRVSQIRSARRLDTDKPIMSLVQLTVGAPDLGIEVMPAAAAADDVEGGTKEEDVGADDAAAHTASPAATEEAHGTSESTGARSTDATTTTTTDATTTTEAATAAESSKPSSSPPCPPDDEPALPEWFGEMSELEQVDVLDRAADGTDSKMEVEIVEVRARAGAESAAPGVAVVGRLLEGSGKSSVMDVLWAVKFAMEAKNVPGSAVSAGAGTGGDPGST